MSIEKHPSAPSVAPELLERLRTLPVALISDQLHRNRGFAGLRPYHRPAPLAGTAVTVRTRGGDNLAILRALEFCRPGDVMVVDADGECANALVGGIITFYAASIGMAGMVLDGAIRDIAEIGERTFPVYARGHTHRGPYKDGPGAINVPLSIGGLTIAPGDIIVAIGGKPVDSVAKLLGLLDDRRVGEAVPVEVLREGGKTELTVTLEAGS